MAFVNTSGSAMTTAPAPTYVVSTVISPPYVMMKEGGGYEGFVVDILGQVARKVGFRYDIRPAADGMYGSVDHNTGQWNGMIGELVRNEADIAAGDLTITQERERVVDFSKPFISQGIRLLVKKPEAPEQSLGLLVEPFSVELWFLILIAFIIISLLFILIGRFSPYEWTHVPPGRDPRGARHSFGLRDSFMFTFSTLTWQGYRETPRSLSGRCLAVFWFMFALFAIVAYTASLTAFFLAREQALPSMPFKNYNDLIEDGTIDIGTVRNGLVFETLRNNVAYKNIFDYIVKRKTLVDTREDGVRRVKSLNQKFVMLMEATTAEFFATYNCDLMVYGPSLVSTGQGFATRLGLDIRDHINFAILELREDGTLAQLQNKWWDFRRCGNAEEEREYKKKKESPLTAYETSSRDMAVAFLLLMVGATVSIILLVVENIVSRLRTTIFSPGSRRTTEDRITGDRIQRFNADGSDTKHPADDSTDGARGQP